jgi:hypothetical protein
LTSEQLIGLLEHWQEHKRFHGGVQIECEACFEGNYGIAHRCTFIDLTEDRNTPLLACNSSIEPGSIQLGELFAVTNYLATNSKIDLDAHFYHFITTLLNEKAKLVVDEIRYSTTNRTAQIPGAEIITQYGCKATVSLLYRGLRVNEETFQDFLNLERGAIFPSSAEVICATELHSRGLDYSRRIRPADVSENNCGVLLEISGAVGLPIAYLSTHPIEREWRIAGSFRVSAVISDIDPHALQTDPSQWTARHWKDPINYVKKWCLLKLDAM